MIGLLNSYANVFRGLNRNVWVLAGSMLVNRSGSMVLMFTSLYLTRDLGFSMKTAGWILSFYGFGSVLGSFFGGWLTDRFHHFPIMVASLAGSGAILLLLPVLHSEWAICSLIFLYAFVGDIFRPANSAAIAAFSTVESRTRSVSLVRLAVNLGFSVGPAAGGFVAIWYGYHTLFYLDAATSMAAALLLVVYLPSGKGQSAKKAMPSGGRGASAYQDLPYLIFIFLVAVYGTCFFQLFSSMPQFFKEVCGYSEDVIGLLLALNGFLVVVIEMPIISFLERKGSLFSLIVLGVLCIPVSFLCLYFGEGLLVWAVVYTLIITLSEILAMPFMMNFALSRGGTTRTGEYSALYSISYGIATILAPSLGLGLAAMAGFPAMLLVFSGVALLNALAFYLLPRFFKMEQPGVS
jgi:predicted MFS family arabinose efflux permease